jgi:hypothetical protein
VQLRTLEERGIGELDDDEVRRTPRIERDARPGQFSQPDGEVQLGVRIVRRPALAARFAIDLPAVSAAAEIEAVAEGVGRGTLGRGRCGRSRRNLAPELRGCACGDAEE